MAGMAAKMDFHYHNNLFLYTSAQSRGRVPLDQQLMTISDLSSLTLASLCKRKNQDEEERERGRKKGREGGRKKVSQGSSVGTHTSKQALPSPTFLAGLQRDISVRVTGETNDAQLGKLGQEVVSPSNGHLRGNEVHLQRQPPLCSQSRLRDSVAK